jgi:hypothetical protein
MTTEHSKTNLLPPLFEPVDLSPFARSFPRTWIRPLRDEIVDPEKQLRFAGNVGHCELVDLDAGQSPRDAWRYVFVPHRP